MPKAFISYARDGGHGEHLANEIQQQLQAAGFTVFRDVTGLKPGDPWFHKLEFELETSDVMVLVLSEKVRKSKWVHNEFSMAEERNIPILPILAENIPSLPLWIRHLQFIDFSLKHDWDSLLSGVKYQIHFKKSRKTKNASSIKKFVPNTAPMELRLVTKKQADTLSSAIQKNETISPFHSSSTMRKGIISNNTITYHEGKNQKVLSKSDQVAKSRSFVDDIIMAFIMIVVTIGAFLVVGNWLGFFALGVLFVWLWTIFT